MSGLTVLRMLSATGYNVIHLEPIVFTARLLPKGGHYGDSYHAVATVQKIGHTGYVSACKGKINKQAVLDLSIELEKVGITDVKWLHGREI